jgi:hypothetical protein
MSAVSSHVQRMPGFATCRESEDVNRGGVGKLAEPQKPPGFDTFEPHAAIQRSDSLTNQRMAAAFSGRSDRPARA